MRFIIAATIFLFLIFLNGCFFFQKDSLCIFEDENFVAEKKCFSVETAETTESHARGLMHRQKLDVGTGMLFLFEDDAIRHFWMKNTLIPLDIIFISRDWEIREVVSAEPCSKDPCAVYSSQEKVKYALEINHGLSRKYNITQGDFVSFLRASR